MNMQNLYKRDLREKLETLGTIQSESDNQFSVVVASTPEEAHRRIVALMPSAGDIKVSEHADGALVRSSIRGREYAQRLKGDARGSENL